MFFIVRCSGGNRGGSLQCPLLQAARPLARALQVRRGAQSQSPPPGLYCQASHSKLTLNYSNSKQYWTRA